MGKAVVLFVVGFGLAFWSMFFPIVGLPVTLLGLALMFWGAWVFWFRVIKGAAGGAAKVAKAATGNKKGSGTL